MGPSASSPFAVEDALTRSLSQTVSAHCHCAGKTDHSRGPGGYLATAGFTSRVAFIHSVSYGARTEDVIRQSPTKVPLAPASIQSCNVDKSDRERITADSAPRARATPLKSTSGISIGFSVRPWEPYCWVSAP
jgi:hypothetical protein